MRLKRIDEIEAYVMEQKSVSIDQLCEVFNVSKTTLRRDLDQLVQRGTIEKVYGGVTAVTQRETTLSNLISYSERNNTNMDLKNRIAKLAASYIHDNDIVYIDTGTSTLGIIDYLGQVSNLTLITNSVLVASKALAYENIKTIILPGVLNLRTASATGSECLEYLSRYHVQKAFMACTGITEIGAANTSPEESAVKRLALQQSQVHYFLIDHTKFDKSALMVYSPISKMDYVLTDQAPSEKYMKLFETHHVKLAVAEENNRVGGGD